MTKMQSHRKRQVDTTVLAMRAQAARDQLLETVALLDQRTKRAMHQLVRVSTASSALVAALATTWLGVRGLRRAPDIVPEAHTIRSSAGRLRTPGVPPLVKGAAFAIGVFATGLLLRSLLRQPGATGPVASPSVRGGALRSHNGVYRV